MARRFVNLIDTLYDTRIGLVVSAAAEPDGLYPAGDVHFLFERTASRLIEMRSETYLAARSERLAAPAAATLIGCSACHAGPCASRAGRHSRLALAQSMLFGYPAVRRHYLRGLRGAAGCRRGRGSSFILRTGPNRRISRFSSRR